MAPGLATSVRGRRWPGRVDLALSARWLVVGSVTTERRSIAIVCRGVIGVLVVVPAGELGRAFFLLGLLVISVAGVELVDGAACASGRVEHLRRGGDASFVLAGRPGLGGGDLAQVGLDGVLDTGINSATRSRLVDVVLADQAV